MTATLIAGTLRIVGNSDDNHITVNVNVSGISVVVTGNSGTTVNGVSTPAIFPATQVKALDIRMNDGDDVVV
ncbi:MAG: hypothetical protein NZM42_04555, partial [Gemmatales bacterium]|nr:hypothetical protein [Gemmatales bacterium]